MGGLPFDDDDWAQPLIASEKKKMAMQSIWGVIRRGHGWSHTLPLFLSRLIMGELG